MVFWDVKPYNEVNSSRRLEGDPPKRRELLIL